MWDIHAIVMQKEQHTKKQADKIANEILKHKVPIRETSESWRYDNIPQERFIKFKTKVIKEGLSLIVGELI